MVSGACIHISIGAIFNTKYDVPTDNNATSLFPPFIFK